MNQQSFESPGELVTFVNDQVIAQTDIVQIVERDGRWFLFWFTP